MALDIFPPTTLHAAAYGYHTTEIKKGEFGKTSKIREELEELEDAERQGIKIMVHAELADLFGALEAVAEKYGLTMHDLHSMAMATKRAFLVGHRK